MPNSPLHKQADFATRTPPAFSADKVRQRVVEQSRGSPDVTPGAGLACLMLLKILPALTSDQTELWETMEVRIAAVENSVGDNAS